MLAWLKEPLLKGLHPGSPEFFAAQKAIILNRPLLKRCYDDWYARVLRDARSAPQPGVIVEPGSGGSYLKDLEPSIITVTSDVVANVADCVVDSDRAAAQAVRFSFSPPLAHLCEKRDGN
jgi:hypothetical protein